MKNGVSQIIIGAAIEVKIWLIHLAVQPDACVKTRPVILVILNRHPWLYPRKAIAECKNLRMNTGYEIDSIPGILILNVRLKHQRSSAAPPPPSPCAKHCVGGFYGHIPGA